MKNLIRICIIAMFLFLPFTKAGAAGTTAAATAQLVQNSTSGDVSKQDVRAAKLSAFLRSYEPGVKSPLTDKTQYIVSEADKYGVDWRWIVAISGVESTFCKFTPANSHNCWGWGIPTGAQSGIQFATYEDGITSVTKGLREKYLDKGRDNPDSIGRIYAASPAWSWKVKYFLAKIDSFQYDNTSNLEISL